MSSGGSPTKQKSSDELKLVKDCDRRTWLKLSCSCSRGRAISPSATWSCSPAPRTSDPRVEEMVSDWQQPDVQPVVDQTPQTARQEERKGDSDQAQADQIPGAQIGELILDNEEQDRPNDRPFKRAEAANQHHEDQVCRPLHTKNRLRLNEQSVGQRQCPSRAAAETCQHEEGELHGPDANAQGGCDLFVVPDGLERNAGPVAQQEEEEQHQEQREAQCQPVGVRRASFTGINVETTQRSTGTAAQSLVQGDQQSDRFGDY